MNDMINTNTHNPNHKVINTIGNKHNTNKPSLTTQTKHFYLATPKVLKRARVIPNPPQKF